MKRTDPNWWDWTPGIEDGGVGPVWPAARGKQPVDRSVQRRRVDVGEWDKDTGEQLGCECYEIPDDSRVYRPCPKGSGKVTNSEWQIVGEHLGDDEYYEFCRLHVWCTDESAKCDWWTTQLMDASTSSCNDKYGTDVDSKSGSPVCYYSEDYFGEGDGCCMCKFLCQNDDYTNYECTDHGGDSEGDIEKDDFDWGDVERICEPWWKGWPEDDEPFPYDGDDNPLEDDPAAAGDEVPAGTDDEFPWDDDDGDDAPPNDGDQAGDPWDALPDDELQAANEDDDESHGDWDWAGEADDGDDGLDGWGDDIDGDCEISVSAHPAFGLDLGDESQYHLWVSVRTRDRVTTHWDGQPANCPGDWYPPNMMISRMVGGCKLQGAGIKDTPKWQADHGDAVTAVITSSRTRGACKKAQDANICIAGETARINGVPYSYYAFQGPNSNTYAHTIMHQCTESAPNPAPGSTPGWEGSSYPL